MLTANVALKSGIMSQATIDAANELIAYLASDYAASPDFITSACWADDLKSSSAPQEANWHFIDIPVIREPFSGTPAPVPTADQNVWATNQAHSTVYSTKSSTLDKARQLRFIIHLVGDVHQPLHAASLFSDEFPTGDAGGNAYSIAGVDYATNLHSLWDSGAGQWIDDIVRPLNATGQAWLDTFADNIIAAYPVASMQPYIKEFNVSTWANESNTIAADFVYTAPEAPTPVPADYITQAQSIALQQIAIGGYRLADLLEYIFTATPFGVRAYDLPAPVAGADAAPQPSFRLRAGRN